MPTESRSYWRRVSAQGLADWTGGHWLVQTVALGLAGAVCAVCLEALKLTTLHPVWAALIGAVAVPVLWGLISLVVSTLQASAKLLTNADARIQELEREVRRFKREAVNTALSAKLDLQYGPRSLLPVAQRLELGSVRIAELEAEVNAQDFSHGFEILYLKDHLLDVFSKMFPEGAVIYREWHARLFALVAAVLEHNVEVERREQEEEE